jgi:hypothetical protein
MAHVCGYHTTEIPAGRKESGSRHTIGLRRQPSAMLLENGPVRVALP